MKSKRKKFGIELDEDLYNQMVSLSVRRDRFVWELYEQAVKDFLGEPPPVVPHEVTKLSEMLDSADPQTVRILRGIINETYRLFKGK